MATIAPHALYGIYALIDPYFKTNKIGGVVGDAAHGSGYHLSREALKARGLTGDYSIQCPADKRGPSNTAAAIDITFGSLEELITCHKRLRKACTPDANGNYDPRIECVREVIGTLDGRNVSGYNRVATGSASRSRVGWVSSGFSDSSHLWHEHISILRDRVENTNDMRGLAEVIAGVAPGTLGWTGSTSTTAAAVNSEEEELMALDKKTLDAIAQAVLDSDSVPNEFTANAENKNVTLKTALVYLARDNDKILAQQAEILDRLKALAGPSAPQA